MNVFITGGTGYLGSGLVTRLMLENKIKKIALLTRNPSRAQLIISRIESAGNFEFVTGKIQNYDFNLDNIDVVIHMACCYDLEWTQKNSAEAFDEQVGGTLSLIEAVRRFKVPYFIYTSCSAVYGDRGEQNNTLVSEDFQPRPIIVKSLAKYAGELIVRSLADSSTKFVILRLSNIYGVNASRYFEELTTKFTRLCCTGKALQIHNDGTQKIDIVNLRDVSDLIHLLLFSPDEIWNQTYNVGSGQPISINELADVYIEAALQIGLKPPAKSYVDASRKFRPYYLDISKAREKLGWAPSKTIKDGVTELLQDYLNNS